MRRLRWAKQKSKRISGWSRMVSMSCNCDGKVCCNPMTGEVEITFESPKTQSSPVFFKRLTLCTFVLTKAYFSTEACVSGEFSGGRPLVKLLY